MHHRRFVCWALIGTVLYASGKMTSEGAVSVAGGVGFDGFLPFSKCLL